MRILWVFAVIGCGTAPKSDVSEPGVAKPAEFVLPSATPPPAWELACSGSGPRPGRPITFELTQRPLEPVRRGPLDRERSHATRPRSFAQLEDVLRAAESALSGCWKWAASRGAPVATLDLAFTVTPFGTTTAHAVTDPIGQSSELVSCLRDNVVHAAIDEVATRATRMHVKIAFVRANQPAWPKPPQRPAIAVTPRGKQCVPVIDAPADELVSPVVFTVDDSDDSRMPPTGGPTVTVGCLSTSPQVADPIDIRIAIESNRGALQRCYAAARERDASLTGEITLEVPFADGISQAGATASGAGDAAFHECLVAATRDLWIPDWIPKRSIVARYHFALADAGAVDDPEAKLRARVRELRAAKSDLARCKARARIFEAFVDKAPWLDDARVLAATKDLTTAAAKLEPVHATLCLEPVEDMLKRVAYGGQRMLRPNRLRWSWLDRIEAVMPAADRLSWGAALRWFHAATLAMTDRHAEGIALLKALTTSSDRQIAVLADEELDRYDVPKHVQHTSTCPR